MDVLRTIFGTMPTPGASSRASSSDLSERTLYDPRIPPSPTVSQRTSVFGESVFSETDLRSRGSIRTTPERTAPTTPASERGSSRTHSANTEFVDPLFDEPMRDTGYTEMAENRRLFERLRNAIGRAYTPKYRSLDKDPFCTDASFFGSGKFRPTAYCPRDRSQAPNMVPRHEPRRGAYTGAARPEGPRVFRKYGDNTRERVMPYRRYTHMHQSGYDDDVVGSERLPSFLHPAATLGQSGSEAVLAAAGLQRTLGTGRPGSKHYLLDG